MGGGGGIVQAVSSVATAVVAPVLAPIEIAKTVAPGATAQAVGAVSKVPLVGNAAKAADAGSNIIGDYASGNSSQGAADVNTALHSSIPLIAAAAAPAIADFVSSNLGDVPVSVSDFLPTTDHTGAPFKAPQKPGSGGGGGGAAPQLPGSAPVSGGALALAAGAAILLLRKR